MANAIPKSINLGDMKKVAVPAYRRQVIHNTTYQNTYQPGAVLLLPIDTGTASSFMDTNATSLEFTLNLTNSNPFVDYCHLPRCGVNAFIREMSIEVNGVPIEMNRHYAETIEAEMIRKGENQKPFSIFHSNKWRPAHGNAGSTSINFIKPAMIDSYGHPMFVHQEFADQNPCSLNSFGPGYHATQANFYAYNATEAIETALTTSKGLVMYNGPHSLPVGWSETTNEAAPIRDWGKLFKKDTRQDAAAQLVEHYNNCILPYNTAESDQYFSPTVNYAGNQHYGGFRNLPTIWPYHQPSSFNGNKHDYSKDNGGMDDIRMNNVLGFYSNVRCIPIGINNITGPSTLITNATAFSTGSQTTSLHCSVPLYSSIIGFKARKAFVEALIPGGRMMLKLRLQEPEIAMQVSMDPCRRVLGTLRDYVANTGHKSGTAWNADAGAQNTNRKTPSNLCCGVHPIQAIEQLETGSAAAYTYWKVAGACFNDETCMGKEPLPVLSYNDSSLLQVSAMGDISAQNKSLNTTAANLWPYNKSYTDNLTKEIDTVMPCNYNPFGIPLPQYIPCATPWLMKDQNCAAITFVSETANCFGTYLEASRPQTRRCSSSLLVIPTNSDSTITSPTGSSERPTYTISNVQLITEQILLSASLTDELIASALSGGLEVNTDLVKESAVYMPSASTQTQLINIAGSSINDVSFWFRSSNQIQGDVAYGYPSFSFYNPFVSVAVTTSGNVSRANVGGIFTVKNDLNTSDACGLDLQLQVGAENYPRQPIVSVPALVRETEKGDEVLFQQKKKLDLTPHLTLKKDGSNCIYSPFQDGFFATYLPIEALDDQTITANPYFSLAEQSQTPIIPIRGVRAVPSLISSQSSSGVLNIFEPLVGTFHLTFNLNTFMGIRDVARSGATVVNNQMYLKMKKAYLCELTTVELLTIYNVDARVVYETGGNMRVYS
jgi:hypothetical protein